MIRENLTYVHQNMIDACKRAGRNPEEVTLAAVSKTKPLSMIRECMAEGETVFGENYVQELTEKYDSLQKEHPELAGKIKWHMIGHLQRNKVKYIIDKVVMIHSVDSLRLAGQIETEAAKRNLTMDILLEVNIAEEASKWGFTSSEALSAVLHILSECPHLIVRGLMTSAPYTENPEDNRIYFKRLHTLFEEIKNTLHDHSTLHYHSERFDTLSMGMTGDYIVAVEEGSTIVRVGTGIFGERDYH